MERREQAIQQAIKEVMNPQMAATKDVMADHDLVLEDGQPVVARVIEHDDAEAWSVIFPLNEVPYFLVIPVAFTDEQWRVYLCDTLPEVNVYLIIFGTNLTPGEITEQVGILPTSTVHMDQVPIKQRKNPWAYQHKWVYHPQRGVPASLDDKLETLLDDLTPVQEKIAGLAGRAEAMIEISYHAHCRWSMGGMVLEPETLAQLTALKCTLDFDLHGYSPKLPEPQRTGNSQYA